MKMKRSEYKKEYNRLCYELNKAQRRLAKTNNYIYQLNMELYELVSHTIVVDDDKD